MNDYVSITDDNTGLDLTDFTLAAWIRPDTVLVSQWQALISKSSSPNRPASLWLYGDTVQVWFDNTSAIAVSATPVTVGTWQFVAATFDDATDQVRVYINGILDAEATTTVVPLFNDAPLVLGQRGDGSFPYRGALDEVTVWNRALSASEILGLFNRDR